LRHQLDNDDQFTEHDEGKDWKVKKEDFHSTMSRSFFSHTESGANLHFLLLPSVRHIDAGCCVAGHQHRIATTSGQGEKWAKEAHEENSTLCQHTVNGFDTMAEEYVERE
jgi:hypothetical protein